MHFYEVDIAKAMKHRKPFVLNPTNYILTTDDELYQLPELPAGVPYITQEQMIEQLYKQSVDEIEQFISSEYNKDVYIMAVATSEYYDFQLYINTEERYKRSQEKYFTEKKDILELNYNKYNLGNFSFDNQLHNDEILDILTGVHMIEDKVSDFEVDELSIPLYEGDFNNILIIINQSLIKFGHYIAVQEVVKRLKDTGIEAKINKTSDFIFFGAIGYSGTDRSIMMRQTVEREVLYKALPELHEGDFKFKQLKMDLQQRSFHEQVNYWLQEIDNNENSIGESIFEHYYKTEYHAIEALAENINDISNDLLPAWKKSVTEYVESDEQSTALFYLSYVLSEFEEQKQKYLQEIKEHLKMIEQAEQQQEESQGNLKMIRNILMIE
ncbi:hypothetical protein QE450_001027 [Paenibacillus sp. SORGH_AS306]|uniref:hypothetical protein n=1 Tax=unclassified Paenibacillus TaxID=185978 RepID=UPI0027872F01|nr:MULTISPECIES: hypothetical protein [unclassified Paenibacillus]MDQ1233529.1 hypothetical protein [Paenibacillus sp. SORGH_AS_0306]MDR6110570.1 hypothetical protein [Paenibacillus sp. SORGH_AS_0338]